MEHYFSTTKRKVAVICRLVCWFVRFLFVSLFVLLSYMLFLCVHHASVWVRACNGRFQFVVENFFSLSLSVSEQHLLLLTLRPCVLLLLTIFVFSTSPALLLYALLSPTALMTSQPRPHSYFLSSFFLPPSSFIPRYLSRLLPSSLSTLSSFSSQPHYQDYSSNESTLGKRSNRFQNRHSPTPTHPLFPLPFSLPPLLCYPTCRHDRNKTAYQRAPDRISFKHNL